MKEKRAKEVKNAIILALIICGIIYICYSITSLVSAPAKLVVIRKR